MANWTVLSNAIRQVICPNGTRDITGQVLQTALLNIINNLGNYAGFGGYATPSTNPGIPDGPVFYIANTVGTYVNFGNLSITSTDGWIAFVYSNGSWSKVDFGGVSQGSFNALAEEFEEQFNTNEEARDAIVNAKVGEITDLRNDIIDIQNAYKKGGEKILLPYEEKNGYYYGGKGLSDLTNKGYVNYVYEVQQGVKVTIEADIVNSLTSPFGRIISFVESWENHAEMELITEEAGQFKTDYIPSKNGFIAVLVRKNVTVISQSVSVYKMDSSYEDFSSEIAGLYSKVGNDQTIKIKKTGGDFNSIRGALDYISNNPIDGWYNVEVYEGEYDVYADYTQEEIESARYSSSADGFCGVIIGDKTRLIGVGSRDNIIIKGELSKDTYTDDNRRQISTLNVLGNFVLENLTITSNNLRYTIHDDFIASENTIHIVKDCSIINTCGPSGNTPSNSYGMGTRSGQRVIVENCYLSSGFGYHNNTNFTSADRVTLINTQIDGTIAISDGASNVHGVLEILNSSCSLLSHVITGGDQNIFVEGIGEFDAPIISESEIIYNSGNVVKKFMQSGAVGNVAKRRSGDPYYLRSHYEVSNRIFGGIVVGIYDGYYYIQKSGYVSETHLGNTDTSDWSVGDYLGIGQDYNLTKVESKSDAVAIVEFEYQGYKYIHIL